VNDEPLVSIIIAAYNAERFLPATLESIQAQTMQRWECIVVDDGSADQTTAVAADFGRRDSRIRCLSQVNSGPSIARNLGFEASNPASRYITFMDSDDLWQPDSLETLVAAAEAAPGMIGAHGVADFIDEHHKPYRPGEFLHESRNRVAFDENGNIHPVDLVSPTTFAMVFWKNTVFPPGVLLVKREVYRNAGLYDPDLRQIEDWDMLIRLTRFGDIQFVNQIVVFYRRHANNTSAQDQTRNLAAIRKLQCKTFFSPANTDSQRRLLGKSWRTIQKIDIQRKTRDIREKLAKRDIFGAGRLMMRLYVQIHRYLRGYPTQSGL
jgi:glycosyltransferase involved in cell wall biosynthesis